MRLFGLIFLASIFLPVFTITDESSMTHKSNHNSTTIYDDEDFYDPDYHQLNSKFGFINFRISLQTNAFCNSSSTVLANHSFDFSTECNCISSNEYCLHELLKKEYFHNYRWNFTNYSSPNKTHFIRNISSCISNHSLSDNSCIPCQDFYINVDVFLTRKLCWMLDIGILLVFICLVGGICICIFGYDLYRRRRNQYQRIEGGNFAVTRYRFFTTNS